MEMTLQHEQAAKLDYLRVGEPDADLHFVLLHGYGADNQDLAPLSGAVHLKCSTCWYFPNGPVAVPIGPYMMGRAWFPIDMEALVGAQMRGTFFDMSQTAPSGLQDRGRQIARFLMETGLIDCERLVLGGFSQGAMLAIETLFHLAKPPKALVILSGTLLDKARWRQQIARLKPLPFFMSHGQQETLLDPAGAEALYELLDEHSWPGEFVRFRGGHEIPATVLSALTRFLDKVGRDK